MPAVTIPWRPSTRMLRQFAALWVVFGCILAWRLGAMAGSEAGLTVVALALIIGLPGLIWPRTIRRPFLAMFLLTFPIGWVVSHVVLTALYYLVFTPLGLAFRLTGRDALVLRRPARPSHWVPRQPAAAADRYFRQF